MHPPEKNTTFLAKWLAILEFDWPFFGVEWPELSQRWRVLIVCSLAIIKRQTLHYVLDFVLVYKLGKFQNNSVILLELSGWVSDVEGGGGTWLSQERAIGIGKVFLLRFKGSFLTNFQDLFLYLRRFHVEDFMDPALHDEKMRIIHIQLNWSEQISYTRGCGIAPINQVLVSSTNHNL